MPDASSDSARPKQDEGATSDSKGTGTAPASSSAVTEATAAIERRELWVARDLLAAHVREERDVEALRLLGEVHHGMGDLPAAGAAWFGAGVKGPEVDAAVEAWRASHGDDFAAMWRSLPRSVRQEPRSKKVEALRAKALEARDASDAASASAGAVALTASGESSGSGGIDAAQIIAWVIAAFVVVCAVVGLVQILRWMVPGG
ncbi:hypothetical protein ACOCJ5_06170 [Knoellia sp. CPCC 206450]|uniref:hypothetical protein n=1 Tax=Knoellia tibetensis TaxID=3404798 RepID=UPI003B434633